MHWELGVVSSIKPAYRNYMYFHRGYIEYKKNWSTAEQIKKINAEPVCKI